MKIIFTLASAICALVAAALWFKASTVLEKPTEEKDSDGLYPYQMIKTDGNKTWEVFKTAEAQTMWNKRAALAACASAFCQTIALLVP